MHAGAELLPRPLETSTGQLELSPCRGGVCACVSPQAESEEQCSICFHIARGE